MSGSHQVWICLLAVVVAGLTAIPLELQRRIVDEVVRDREMELLLLLAGGYLAVLLVQGVTKYAMHIYQSWLSETAIRHNRAHHPRRYDQPDAGAGRHHGRQAVPLIGPAIDRPGRLAGPGLSPPVGHGRLLLPLGQHQPYH